MGSVDRTWVTANICGNPRRPFAAVYSRIRSAAAVGGRGAVVVGQEISPTNLTSTRARKGWPRRYSAIWRRVMRNHGRVTFQGVTEIPISVPRSSSWRRVRSLRQMLHRGLAAVSPARFATLLAEVHTPTGIKVATVAKHPVSKPRKGVSRSAWRIRSYSTDTKKTRKLVAMWRAKGYTVVVLGDLNKTTAESYGAGQRSVHHRGLDHILVLPAAGVKVQVLHRSVIPASGGMDHPILAATLRFTR